MDYKCDTPLCKYWNHDVYRTRSSIDQYKHILKQGKSDQRAKRDLDWEDSENYQCHRDRSRHQDKHDYT